MDDIRRLTTPILIASPAGHWPPASDRLRRGGQTPSVWDVAVALNDLVLRDVGVPVITRREAQRDDPEQQAVYFCAADFIVRCIVLDDAYELTRLYPPDHLYRLPNWRAIRLVPAEWLVEERDAVHQYASRTDWTTVSWEAIDAAVLERLRRLTWRETTRPLTAAEDSYLEHIDRMIDFTRDVELDRRADKVEIRYERKRATAAARTLRDVYSFDLTEGDEPPFAKGDLVTVDVGEPGAHDGWEAGRVIRAEGRRVTIMFDRKFNESDIANTGTIRTGGGDKQFRLQHRAVDALRRGESRNPHLLAALVERAFPPESRLPSPKPTWWGRVLRAVRHLILLLGVRRQATDLDAGPLQPSQNRILRHAAAVDDVFLTMGPPGTGKTTTIVQMTRDRIGLGEKVLITSRNHKAVDNVLVKFVGRADILVIRLGHEENIEDPVKELLIDRKAQEIQGRITDDILSSFGPLRERVGPWRDADDALVFLRESGATWAELVRERSDALARVRQTQAAIAVAWLPALRLRVAEVDRQRRCATRSRALANAATRSWCVASRWRSWPVVAALSIAAHDWMESRRRRDAEDVAMYRSGVATYEREVSAYRDEVTAAPDVLEAKTEVRRASIALETFAGMVRAKVAMLAEDPRIPLPPAPELAGPADLEAYLRAVTAALPVSWEEMWRYHLHKRWLEVLEERRLALYPALIGAADVVGATCVGIAADARFDDLVFDTVIADECGQILVSDLLVPLVRGRRAVLFGDHMQLPPFIEAQVVERMCEAWQKRGASDDERQSLALVEKSIFEILYQDDRTPSDDGRGLDDAQQAPRKMMLDMQYRMPACIADLISAHFYGGNYRTWPGLRRARDESWLLGGAFCFVDTMHRKEFRERKVTLWGEDGEERVCDNYGEAEVLARLAGAYLKVLVGRGDAEPEHGVGIIVPYKSQVERVRIALAACGLPEGIVATVDSFQGNERDVILFGFTRSNESRDRGRDIGFLRELRRLNVILTRAREQLVLVGDSDTLVNAGDTAFAGFCAALIEHVRGLETRGLGRYLDVAGLPKVIDPPEGTPWLVLQDYVASALDANFDFDPHWGRWGRDASRHRYMARPKHMSRVVLRTGKGR